MKTIILLIMVLCCGFCFAQDKFQPSREPNYPHFMMAVYICSVEKVLDVPMSKVFSDFATHGVEIAWVNAYNYYPLAKEKKLNQYAKTNGVKLIVQYTGKHPAYSDSNMTDEEIVEAIKGQVNGLNALPDSDAVIGWGIGDEIENRYLRGDNPEQRRAHAEVQYQRLSRLFRQVDPNRRITVNHDHMPWMASHEDEAFCSTGFTTRFNAHKVGDRIAEAQKFGFKKYFLVSQACRVPSTIPNLRWYGYRDPINDRVVDSISVAEMIQDHAEVAYTNGSTGCMYFLYWAGGANYLPYTLVDIAGDDYQGKWDAVKKAMQNIRNWEGAPSCRITSPQDRQWLSIGKVGEGVPGWVTESLKITVEVEAPEDDPVVKVECGYSLDGCLAWQSLTDDSAVPYEFSIGQSDVSEGLNECWIRVRAINKQGPSLWDIVKVDLRKL